ncbi:acyltransferase family protein [Mangrovimonas xylaniphaga]|uniref:acyltransferase family protein n=1 Tax=Mangrovimonas xylaniphaga TaxID=1645915 RepID=UPI0006B56910|nr:acyltransferase [Mangrovimonas xylaniphaga]
MQKDKLKFLDTFRGIAAFYVVVGHSRWLLWEGYSSGYVHHTQDYTFFQKCMVYFMGVFKYGHEAVLFFFVLSGFVIHLNYHNKFGTIQETKSNILKFYFKRFKRIYPVLIFALVLTFICDSLILQLNPDFVWGDTNYKTINEFITFNHGFAAVFGGLFNMGRLGFPVFGSNGPLWSLAYEWWFYMFYPVLYIKRNDKTYLFYTLIFLAALFSAFLSFRSVFFDKIFIGMASWAIGCLLAEIYLKRTKLNLEGFVFVCLSLSILYYIYPFMGKDFFMALVFGALLSLCLKFSSFINRYAKFKKLGDMSYTLYIVHFPLLVVGSSVLMNNNHGNLPIHFGYTLLGVLGSLLFAYLFFPIFEIRIPELLENMFRNGLGKERFKQKIFRIKRP